MCSQTIRVVQEEEGEGEEQEESMTGAAPETPVTNPMTGANRC